jgi:hypothetical protein
MPVNSKHPDYEQQLPKWKRCRDVYEGSDAVKSEGEDYLPRPSGQSRSEYAAYVNRSLFFDSMARTIEGLVGAISRKDPAIEAPGALEAIMKDITLTGISFSEFIKSATREILITGRVGIYADWSDKAKRPYLTFYRAEQMINWFGDGSVVIEEGVCEASSADPFKTVSIKQWRHLAFNEEGVYTVTIYRQKERSGISGDEFYVHETQTPNSRGEPLKAIPFGLITQNGAATCIEKPPLIGLADVVLSHYKTSADLEHGRHFTALPTLYVTGCADDKPIHIGGSAAIVLSEPNAKVGYAEFSGAGLASLEKGLEQKEQQMATLGAGLFGGKKGGVEAAETARIRTSGENSLLAGIVSAMEDGMEKMLSVVALWMRAKGKLSLSMNRDFIGEKISADEIQALVKAFIAGAITLEVFLHNLEVGEALPPGMTIEEIAAQARSEQREEVEQQARTDAAKAMKKQEVPQEPAAAPGA